MAICTACIVIPITTLATLYGKGGNLSNFVFSARAFYCPATYAGLSVGRPGHTPGGWFGNNQGCKSIVWRCISRREPIELECHARTVNEPEWQEAVVAALNALLGNREGYQKQLQQNIAAVIRASATVAADDIDERLPELQQELLKRANSKKAYDEIADEIFRLRELKQQTTIDIATGDEQLGRITELQNYIRSQPTRPVHGGIEVWPARGYYSITVIRKGSSPLDFFR